MIWYVIVTVIVIVIVIPVEALFRSLHIQSHSATPESGRQIPAPDVRVLQGAAGSCLGWSRTCRAHPGGRTTETFPAATVTKPEDIGSLQGWKGTLRHSLWWFQFDYLFMWTFSHHRNTHIPHHPFLLSAIFLCFCCCDDTDPEQQGWLSVQSASVSQVPWFVTDEGRSRTICKHGLVMICSVRGSVSQYVALYNMYNI